MNHNRSNDDDSNSVTTILPLVAVGHHRRSKFGNILENVKYPILSEALEYLDVVSIFDKKLVCQEWNDTCDKVINQRGRNIKLKFVDNRQLRNAVKRYVKGDPVDIETIAEQFGYPIGKWDVSKVTDFSGLFERLKRFNEDIGLWDVSNGVNMNRMFHGAEAFNQNLARWDVSHVRDMGLMFAQARAFNGDLSTWDTSRVTVMQGMFKNTEAFNGDLSGWNTAKVKHMNVMFKNAQAFNGDLSQWNITRVDRMDRMFDGAYSFDKDSLCWDCDEAAVNIIAA